MSRLQSACLVLCLFLMGGSAFAGMQSEDTFYLSHQNSEIFAEVHGIYAVQGKSTLPGLGVSLLTHLSSSLPPSLYVGGEMNVLLFSSSKQSQTLVPILAKGEALFPIVTDWSVSLGAAAGPSVLVGSGATRTDFDIFAEPGILWNLTSSASIHLSPTFGYVGDQFTFMPEIGASLAL